MWLGWRARFWQARPTWVGDIASGMVRMVVAARTPLVAAELAVSPVLGTLDRMAPRTPLRSSRPQPAHPEPGDGVRG